LLCRASVGKNKKNRIPKSTKKHSQEHCVPKSGPNSVLSLLCGRPVGRIRRLDSLSPSICLFLSVCPSTLYGLVTRKRTKIKIGVDLSMHGTSKWSANFQSKGQRSWSLDVKNICNLTSCLRAGCRSSAGASQVPTAN